MDPFSPKKKLSRTPTKFSPINSPAIVSSPRKRLKLNPEPNPFVETPQLSGHALKRTTLNKSRLSNKLTHTPTTLSLQARLSKKITY
ncbi:hypothetical protein HMI56_004896 [Coelomomyces lativittatus]|nr:hypothetical protein HMI56_004896 [Coelomomyces lativittatus]